MGKTKGESPIFAISPLFSLLIARVWIDSEVSRAFYRFAPVPVSHAMFEQPTQTQTALRNEPISHLKDRRSQRASRTQRHGGRERAGGDEGRRPTAPSHTHKRPSSHHSKFLMVVHHHHHKAGQNKAMDFGVCLGMRVHELKHVCLILCFFEYIPLLEHSILNVKPIHFRPKDA